MLIAYGLLLVAVGMDIKSMRISNRLILMGLGIALVRRFICGGMTEVFTGIFLISLPVIVLYLLFLAGVIGAGDIKLFSLIGGFVNFKELLGCMVLSFVFGAVLSLGKMLFGDYEWGNKQKNRIHFSIAIFFGLIATNWL